MIPQSEIDVTEYCCTVVDGERHTIRKISEQEKDVLLGYYFATVNLDDSVYQKLVNDFRLWLQEQGYEL